VAVSGRYAYLGDKSAGVQVVDVGNPTAPVIVGNYDTPGRAYGTAVDGDLLFVADGGFGFRVLDITHPADPQSLGSCDTPNFAYDLAVSGNLVYIADGNSGIQVVDVTDPTAPVIISALDTPGTAYDIAIEGDYGYVGDRLAGFHVISVANPESLAIIGTNGIPYDARGLAVAGDYCFLADISGGLMVMDVSDPTHPVYVAGQPTTDGAYDIALTGDLALASLGFWGFEVFDISDPLDPVSLGTVDTDGFAYSIDFVGDYAYVADDVGGLQIVEFIQRRLEAGANLVRSLRINSGAHNVARAEITTVQTDSIKWELSPNGWAWFELTPGDQPYQFAAPGTLLYWRATLEYTGPDCAPSCSELTIRWFSDETGVSDGLPLSGALLPNVPNPFNPSTTVRFDVPADCGPIRLDVFDLAGRLVRTLVDGELPPGRREVLWDGRDALGHGVASGVYYCRLSGPDFSDTRKMTLVK
jgi:hypothetical protein